MPDLPLEALGHYDALYLSPHLDDVALSCVARLGAERRRGRRCLVATLFSAGGPEYEARRKEDEAAAALLGVDLHWCGLVDAPYRSSRYRSFAGIVLDRDPLDAQTLGQARKAVAQLVVRTSPERVFAPLGVGGHIDHQLVHEAAVAEAGARLWFYEDRPYALVRGQVERRLRQLGERERHLGWRERVRLVSDFARAGYVHSYLRPWDAVRAAGMGLSRPRGSARLEPGRWRVEMVIESPDTYGLASQVLACYASQWPLLFRSLRRFEAQTRRYTARISPVPGYVERLWRRE